MGWRIGLRPTSCPHQMPVLVARIVAMQLALVRHGPVAARRRRRREDYRRSGRPRAMDLWQMDVMGQVFLVGGAEVKVATGIDDHSRLAGAPRRCRGPRRSCRRAGMNPDSWPTIDGLFVGHDTADGGKGLPSAAVSPSGGQPSNLMSTRPDCCICGLSGCSVRKRLPANCVTNAH